MRRPHRAGGGLNSEADLLLSSMASDNRRRAAFDALMEKTAGYVESKCDFDAIGTDVLASHRYLPVVDSVIIERVGAETLQGLLSKRYTRPHGRSSGRAYPVRLLPAVEVVECDEAHVVTRGVSLPGCGMGWVPAEQVEP